MILHAMSPWGDVLIYTDNRGRTFIKSGCREQEIEASTIDFHIDKGDLIRVDEQPFQNHNQMIDCVNTHVRNSDR